MVHSYSMCWMPSVKVANGASEKIHEKYVTNSRCRRMSWMKYNKMQQQQLKRRWKNILETVINPNNHIPQARNSSWDWEGFYSIIIMKQGSEDWPMWNSIHNFSSDKFNDIKLQMRGLENTCTENKMANSERLRFDKPTDYQKAALQWKLFFQKRHWLLW